MSESQEFGLVKSFDVDDGQLDGLSPQEIFVLGYELGRLDTQLSPPDSYQPFFHADNKERIEKSFADAGIEMELKFAAGDSSENWLTLHVKD